MRITIVGTGYVGLVTGTCFAEMGNHVTCVDVDEAKLTRLRNGEVPIHEPGLDELVARNLEEGRLDFSNTIAPAIHESEVIFIAVGTPPNEDGSADLSHVLAVATEIGRTLEHSIVIANKSTVPVGTGDLVRSRVAEELASRGASVTFDVVSNPEFLREGSAVKDFMYPDRIVVGTRDEKSVRVMEELYDAFAKKENRLQFVGIRDAEMIKYAANAMLATKISFMNEVSLMCDAYGIDVENVRRGIGTDPRIGPSFIYAGCGYGGSCFPKDVRAIIALAEHVGIDADILKAVEQRNRAQKKLLVEKVRHHFGDTLEGRSFALWGLAFKPDTDDVREAPSQTIVRELIEAGASVRVYDPEAMSTFRDSCDPAWITGGQLVFAHDAYAATEGADALLVVTEWRQFKQPDFRRLASALTGKVIFDGRNIYNPRRVEDYGLAYVGIGRSAANESLSLLATR